MSLSKNLPSKIGRKRSLGYHLAKAHIIIQEIKMTRLTKRRIYGLLEALADEASCLKGEAERMPGIIFPARGTSKKINDISYQGLIDIHARAGRFIDALTKKENAPDNPIESDSNDMQARLAGLQKMMSGIEEEIKSIEKLSLPSDIKNKLTAFSLALVSETNNLFGQKKNLAFEFEFAAGIDDAISQALKDSSLSIYKVCVEMLADEQDEATSDTCLIAIAGSSSQDAQDKAIAITPIITVNGCNEVHFPPEVFVSSDTINKIKASLDTMSWMEVSDALKDITGISSNFLPPAGWAWEASGNILTKNDVVALIMKKLYQEPELTSATVDLLESDSDARPQ